MENETINAFSQIVSNVGFPIVAFFMMYKMVEKLQSSITELTVTLKNIDTRIQQLEEKK